MPLTRFGPDVAFDMADVSGVVRVRRKGVRGVRVVVYLRHSVPVEVGGDAARLLLESLGGLPAAAPAAAAPPGGQVFRQRRVRRGGGGEAARRKEQG